MLLHLSRAKTKNLKLVLFFVAVLRGERIYIYIYNYILISV